MKQREKVTYLTAGMILSLLLVQVILPVGAALATKTIQVATGVSIYVDDKRLSPVDGNGDPIETFIYNGTTYLPVRAVSEVVGLPVQWDGTTSSVYIGKHAGEKPAVWLKDLDYFTGKQFRVCRSDKDNMGTTYTDTLGSANWDWDGINNVYKLNGLYSKMTGVFYQRYENRGDTQKSSLRIYGDGELLCSATMNGGIEPIPISVDLTGVLELKVEFYSPYSYSAIADCGLWT